MNTQTNSPKQPPSVEELRKIISGETKHSTKARFLSIEEQKRLGIPTDSVSISFNPLKRQ